MLTFQAQDQAQVIGRQLWEKAEELSFEIERTAASWNREYQISDKAEKFLGGAVDGLRAVDEKLQIRRRVRNAQADFKLKWPQVRDRICQA